jgi:hypothetical protein
MASEKTKFAQPPFSQQDIAALNRLAMEWTQKSKDMKGKRTEDGMNAEWEAASIAAHLAEIADLAKSGQAHRAYAKVRTSAPAVQKIMPASLLRAAEEAKKFSRPGAKDKMALSNASATMLQEAMLKYGNKAKKADLIAWLVVYEMMTHPERFKDAEVENAIANLKLAGGKFRDKNARPGEKDTMAVEDRFYFGK